MPSPEPLERLADRGLLKREPPGRAEACLAHTVAAPAPVWRLLVKCHEERNRIEYEGMPNVNEILVSDLTSAARELLARVRELPRHEEPEA